MSEAEILAKTYYDTMTVYRNQVEVDEKTLESEFKEVCVYLNTPCALSLSDNTAPSEAIITSKIENEMVLFTTPEIILEANDKVIVTTSNHAIYEGITSKTFSYQSHGETTFKIHKTV